MYDDDPSIREMTYEILEEIGKAYEREKVRREREGGINKFKENLELQNFIIIDS